MNAFRLWAIPKRLALALSLFGVHLWEDPNDLLVKISQKARGFGITISPLRIPSPSGKGDSLYERGELTLSIAEFEKSGIRGAARARKIRRQVEELDTAILKSKEL